MKTNWNLYGKWVSVKGQIIKTNEDQNRHKIYLSEHKERNVNGTFGHLNQRWPDFVGLGGV